MEIITSRVPEPFSGVYRYVQQSPDTFNDICFDSEALTTQGLISGRASAGRGNTVFFSLHDEQLVLRHYHRGGLAQRLSQNRYVFTGMHRTRAFLEFDMLLHLQNIELPAPRPYACRVLRHGILYSASLVTHRLTGHTLAQRIQLEQSSATNLGISETCWRDIGGAIARFHAAGIYHADLNAHNIMLEDDGRVVLIDFDRSRRRSLPAKPASSGWCHKNLDRLERSLRKIMLASSSVESAKIDIFEGFALCKRQWAESMGIR